MKELPSGLLVFCLLLCGACGGDDDDDGTSGAGSGSGGGGAGAEADGGDGVTDADAGVADAGDAGTEYQGPICGDGVQEGLEQCDDGNYDDRDGCNSLCELSCETDEDCSDLNPCNGEEKCTADNACEVGESLADGEACGNERSCWNGLCLSDICGDGAQQVSEECDDGNLVADDGCTPYCKFTCLSTDDTRDCSGGDLCSGSATCDDATHTCSGSALPDQTDCALLDGGGPGWCIKGVCVPAACGDGVSSGDEQCDEGEDNGAPGSGCSIDCLITQCGNGTIEAGEQCDDKNLLDLDGCDDGCRAEITHRMIRMDVLKDLPPDFCVYDSNRFGDAFPGPVDLSFVGMGVVDVMGFINDFLNASIDDGGINVIYQIRGSSDPSFITSDDEIWLATYRAEPAETWQAGPPLDFPFLIADNLDQDRKPVQTIEASQRGGGPVSTSEPVNVAAQTPIGELTLFNMLMQVVYDVSSASTPDAPPEMAAGIEIPETFGVDQTGRQPYRPAGRMCGATSAESLSQIAWAEQAVQCCPDEGGSYTVCQEGDEVGVDCTSFLDLIEGGCNICLAGCTPGCGFNLITGIDPDVDIDGDGVLDGFSVLLGIESRRVRVSGVSQ